MYVGMTIRTYKKRSNMSGHINIQTIHPFPARMAPAIIWDELPQAFNADGRDGSSGRLRVLDPMAGSGTTIATARLLGHYAQGFDTDPLAVLIANAWSTDVNPVLLREAATDVTAMARVRARSITTGMAYPLDADEETREFIRYWYDLTARKHLAALSEVISEFPDSSIKTLLWCAFSRLIIVKSNGASRAMDVAHSRPHRVYDIAPVKPLDQFMKAAITIARRSPFSKNVEAPAAIVAQGDARNLPIQDSSIDIVITSPPYLNAIDYLRGHKLSLVWMGYSISSLRSIRSGNVGTEVSAKLTVDEQHLDTALGMMGNLASASNRNIGMLRRYARDMNAVMKEVSRVLVDSGRAVFVVGDSTLRGTFIQNSKMLQYLGDCNRLEFTESRTRPLPANRRYLPPPESSTAGNRLAGRMREEVILTFVANK